MPTIRCSLLYQHPHHAHLALFPALHPQDEVTCRLWDLHRYERARCGGQVMEELYLANGHVLLHDDNCYRISYGEQVQAGSAPSSSADTSSTTLAVQLMDTSRSEAPVSATDPVFNDYIKWVPADACYCCCCLLLLRPAATQSCSRSNTTTWEAMDDTAWHCLCDIHVHHHLPVLHTTC